jgi:cation-transporting ATPase I
MLGLIKKLFGGKPAEPVAVPYKVETPLVEVAQPAVEPTAAEVSAENKAVAVAKAKRAPAKKAPIKKAPTPKAPRKPKAP